VRVAAASLAFDVAAANHAGRVGKADVGALAVDAQFELLAAMAEALGREAESKEAVTGLILALGLLVHLAPVEGELLDLARTLEVGKVARRKLGMGLKGDGVVQAVGLLEKGV
jgi:hypothetical protein